MFSVCASLKHEISNYIQKNRAFKFNKIPFVQCGCECERRNIAWNVEHTECIVSTKVQINGDHLDNDTTI